MTTTPETAPGEISWVDLHPPLADFRREVLTGLRQSPKYLSAKFFYDERGSQLFEAITELPEYYLTRTEVALLADFAADLERLLTEPTTIIELGSGNSSKIRILLEACSQVRAYMPVDISGSFLRASAESLSRMFPSLKVIAVCADYTKLVELPDSGIAGPRLVFFPGSTIGNIEPGVVGAFLSSIAALLKPKDMMLIGVDLKKSKSSLDAAYNDAAGITAEFNLNLLHRINRELGSAIPCDRFEHLAFYDERAGRIEMHLRSLDELTLDIAGEKIPFAAGETIHTENSYKYTAEEFKDLVRNSGFSPRRLWVDEHNLFSIHLLSVEPA